MRERNFFAELKRRNVYKVAVAYAVVAWLLIQAASILFPTFEAPAWVMKVVFALVALGFPIALVLAWAFELTPEGIKRAEDVQSGESITRRTGRKLVALTVGLAVIAAGLLAFQFLQSKSSSSTALARPLDSIPAKSIAVLPFDNLTEEKANAYFAEGIQDEILTRLAKVAELKVISRTSTQQFKSAPANLREIAKQLGVANILEGTVQRSPDQVRVNVQLINAATDGHLWAEIYDRKMTDIFALESEIAKAIADKLQAKLTGNEEHAIVAKPTESTEAHDLYLKGRYFWSKRTAKDLRTATSYFEAATKADPKYALAYAGIADSYLLLPFYGGETEPAETYPKVKEMAEKAIALDPTLPEPHASLGLLHTVADYNFTDALRELERAVALDPNYATAHHWLGNAALPPLGLFDRAIAESKRAVELDPLSVNINNDLGGTYWYAGRFKEAIVQHRKAVELAPDLYYPHYNLAQALQCDGDLPGAIAEYETAVRLDDDPYPLGLLGAAKAKAGDRDRARAILRQLEELKTRRYVPDYSLALIHLELGEDDEALRWLESSYAHRQADVNGIRVDAFLRRLHGNPRFEALAEKIVPARDFKGPADSK
jgi:TolB-like protein/Flp pilus assembly protein TadD